MKRYISALLLMTTLMTTNAQTYNQIDEMGNVTQHNDGSNQNFNPHNNDSTKSNKVIPKGLYVWTVDRKFGDIRSAEVDTLPHLYPATTLNTGTYGEYNTTGNNYTARLNRIYIDRPMPQQFMFTEPYSYVYLAPDQLHFTNTLSPITNISYDNCGDKNDGEDHLRVKFAVNAGKRIGLGFDLNYAYARGYYANQATSHFGATFYGSYLGDQYNMHAMFSTYHQKATENGGITTDQYIVHPESMESTFNTNEIPTVLTRDWNRNDNLHLFLTHRYSLGFYREEKMTEAERKAKQFAKESKKEKLAKEKEKQAKENEDGGEGANEELTAGLELAGTTKESSDSTKKAFVPVTSIIHTLEAHSNDRTYVSYGSTDGLYANSYFKQNYTGSRDSLNDQTKHLQVKNTVALALLEGFNKWAKAGLKLFATHEIRNFEMDDTLSGMPVRRKETENNISIGGQLIKSQGRTLHYNASAELWTIGEDAGQLKADFNTDLNFRLFGDTLTLAAHGHFYRLHPTYYQRHYHSKHFWWDNNDLSKETHTRIEGLFKYQKTKTTLRVAIEEIQNFTYLGMAYLIDESNLRKGLTATINQNTGNINLLTAQLQQHIKLGPLNWENVLTYQNSSNQEVLPLPAFNIFTNLYLGFKIARVLSVELGACATYFTEYDAPDFCPQLNQYAIQENPSSRVSLGNFPFIDAYVNMHLKRARFFVMMNNVGSSLGNRMSFLAPHYPINSSVLHMGVSWNFFN